MCAFYFHPLKNQTFFFPSCRFNVRIQIICLISSYAKESIDKYCMQMIEVNQTEINIFIRKFSLKCVSATLKSLNKLHV